MLQQRQEVWEANRDELWRLCGSSVSSPFLRSLSGGRLCVGCSDSSSISWVTASLWGLGTSRFDISQSPSAPNCLWEAWGSILPQEVGEALRQPTDHRPCV